MATHSHPLHLHRRVQVLTLTSSQDQQGGFIDHWQPAFKMWMHIKPGPTTFKASSEIEHGLRRGTVNEAAVTYQGWARHHPMLVKGMCVVCSDHRTFIILDTPCKIKNDQSFHLGLSHPGDGGPR